MNRGHKQTDLIIIDFAKAFDKVHTGGFYTNGTCADPGIFVRGGPGQCDKKSSDNVFFFF